MSTKQSKETTSASAGADVVEGVRDMVLPVGSGASKSLAHPSDTALDVATAASRGRSMADRPELPPIPNGWYAICASTELSKGEIHSVAAVERELVVYRDDNGIARVVGAHCPHLGAHLGGGRVAGATIKCPYHGWQFGPDGKCIDIPYSDGPIPERACVPSYHVDEKDGFVYFWYHAGGKSPTYQIPSIFEVADPQWTDSHPWKGELVAALQEMAENNVDYVHLRYVHGRAVVPGDTSEFTTDGPFSKVVESLPSGQKFTRDSFGPGLALLRVPDLMTVLANTTPIDQGSCRLHWHFYFPRHLANSAAEIIEGVIGEHGLQADVPIWRDKIFRKRPLIVKGDGPIMEFRKWYSQFYEV